MAFAQLTWRESLCDIEVCLTANCALTRRSASLASARPTAFLLHLISSTDIMSPVNAKQRKVLVAIFFKPTMASIVFSDIESLVRALGGMVLEREGSRVSVQLMGEEWRCHRPHPGKEAKRYQVEQARDLLDRVGVRP